MRRCFALEHEKNVFSRNRSNAFRFLKHDCTLTIDSDEGKFPLSFPPVVQNDRHLSQFDADNVYSDNRVDNPYNFQHDNSKLAENVSSCWFDMLTKVAVNSLPLEILKLDIMNNITCLVII